AASDEVLHCRPFRNARCTPVASSRAAGHSRNDRAGRRARSLRRVGGRNAASARRMTRDLVDLNQALTRGEIAVLDWQASVARLNQSVSVAELVRYFDIDRLTSHFSYPLLLQSSPIRSCRRMSRGRGGAHGSCACSDCAVAVPSFPTCTTTWCWPIWSSPGPFMCGRMTACAIWPTLSSCAPHRIGSRNG